MRNVRLFSLLATLGVLVSLWGPAIAADVAAPTDPTAVAAFAVLRTHCARCHEARIYSGEYNPSSFDNVLNLDELARDPTMILPGNPEGSRLYRTIVTLDHFADCAGCGPPPTDSELGAIYAWIKSLPASTPAR